MKLMVALDESSFAEEVLPVAAALAAAGSAELVLTTVVKSSEQHGTRAVQPDIPEEVRARADVTGALNGGDWSIHQALRDGAGPIEEHRPGPWRDLHHCSRKPDYAVTRGYNSCVTERLLVGGLQ